MKFSVVTTMYQSAPYLEEFYKRITAAIRKVTTDYELIFVDDGSPDSSLSIAVEIHKTDKKVKVIELSRNFGHHQAMLSGLEETKGDVASPRVGNDITTPTR